MGTRHPRDKIIGALKGGVIFRTKTAKDRGRLRRARIDYGLLRSLCDAIAATSARRA